MERKEEQIKQSIRWQLQKTTYPVTTENLGFLFFREWIIAFAWYKNIKSLFWFTRPIDQEVLGLKIGLHPSNFLDAQCFNNLVPTPHKVVCWNQKSAALALLIQASYPSYRRQRN